MDSALSPSHLKHITYADKGKSKVLGLGKVAISKDRHMDKVMLVESLGFDLMSVSMLCVRQLALMGFATFFDIDIFQRQQPYQDHKALRQT